MAEFKVKIVQLSRIMGGTLPADGPPRAGQEVFLRPVNNGGKKSHELLVGTYRVFLELVPADEATISSPDFNPWAYSWGLEQSNLFQVGARLTINLKPMEGVLEVFNAPVSIEDGAVVARLIGVEIPDPLSCNCENCGCERKES